MYDIQYDRNIECFLATIGLSTTLILGKGLAMIQTNPNDALIHIIIGGTLVVLSMRAAFKYFQHSEEYEYLKGEKDNLILDRVNKLVRKK